MSLRVVAGSAHVPLATAVAGGLSCGLAPCAMERFPDGEVLVLANVRRDDVHVIEPRCWPMPSAAPTATRTWTTSWREPEPHAGTIGPGVASAAGGT